MVGLWLYLLNPEYIQRDEKQERVWLWMGVLFHTCFILRKEKFFVRR